MRVLIPLADGVEELEAVTLIDVLRRSGVQLALSEGMRPKPRIKVAMPRPVATEAWSDIVEVELQEGVGTTRDLADRRAVEGHRQAPRDGRHGRRGAGRAVPLRDEGPQRGVEGGRSRSRT